MTSRLEFHIRLQIQGIFDLEVGGVGRTKGQHYENLSIAIYKFFLVVKMTIFTPKVFDIFLIFAQNIDCEYTLEPPWRGGSDEYLQSMFWSKNRYMPAYSSFAI